MAGVVLARAEGKLFAVAVLIIFFSLQLSGYAYIPFEVYRILPGSFIKLAWSTFFCISQFSYLSLTPLVRRFWLALCLLRIQVSTMGSV